MHFYTKMYCFFHSCLVLDGAECTCTSGRWQGTCEIVEICTNWSGHHHFKRNTHRVILPQVLKSLQVTQKFRRAKQAIWEHQMDAQLWDSQGIFEVRESSHGSSMTSIAIFDAYRGHGQRQVPHDQVLYQLNELMQKS